MSANGFLEAAREDQADEALGKAYQLLVQAVARIQQAQKLQEQKLMRRIQEAVHHQELKLLELTLLNGEADEPRGDKQKLLTNIGETITKSNKAVLAMVQRLEERLQKLEDKVEKMNAQPPLIVGREKHESFGGEERQLKSQVAKLETAIENSLGSVLFRIETLEKCLAKNTPLAVHTTPHTASTPVRASTCPNVLSSSPAASSSSSSTQPPDNPVTSTHHDISISPALSSIVASSEVSPLVSPVPSTPVVLSALANSSQSGNALLVAVKEGRVNDVQNLLDAGVDINYSDEKKRNTALHEAVFTGHENVVSLLLRKNVSIDSRNCTKDTPLHIAARKGQTAIMSMLLEKNCDVNARNSDGITALHLAAHSDSTGECVSLLIRAGALISSRNSQSATPLHEAASAGNPAAVKVLLAARASKSVKNGIGKTPFDVAETDALRSLLDPQGNVFTPYVQK